MTEIHYIIETPDVLVTNDPEVREIADFLVCANLPAKPEHTPRTETTCADCGTGIYHSGTKPQAADAICWGCAERRIDEKEAKQ